MMTKEEVQVLRDIQGWIDFCIMGNNTLMHTLSHIGHDINGIVNEDIGFLPRTRGYAKFRGKEKK